MALKLHDSHGQRTAVVQFKRGINKDNKSLEMAKSGKSILIVEDEILFASHCALILTELDYDVVKIVFTWHDVLQETQKNMPCLVLMDINLGGAVDGVEIANQIQELYSIPVVLMTGYADAITRERAMTINPAGFLIKPINEESLIMTIENACSNWEPQGQQKLFA